MTVRLLTSEDRMRALALIEAGFALPPELRASVVDELKNAVSADFLRLRRDQHLCLAGDLIGGSVNARARGILTFDEALNRNWPHFSLQSPAHGNAKGEVHAARLLGTIPRARRLRIILGER